MLNEEFIPCGPWLPDQPDFSNPGCNVADNVVPKTATTFTPMRSFAPVAQSSPLSEPPLKAFSAVDLDGNPATYAGSASHLYLATNGTAPNFRNADGGQTFNASSWSFAEMDGVTYASNGTDPLQSIPTATVDGFSPVNVNAPTAKFIASIRPGYLICGNINDPTVGLQPQAIRWSALGDATDWPLIGSDDAIAKGSDWQNVTGDYGTMQAIAPDLASCNAAVFMERAIFSMIFTGDEKIFDITPVDKERGTPAPASVVQWGQYAYYLGPDGFYAFDGTSSVSIGSEKVNQTFLKDADPNYLANVTGTVDPLTGIVFWAYAGGGNNSGFPNRILVYNARIDRFSRIVDFSGDCLFLGRTFGVSLDNIASLGYTLDTLPFSLDSAQLAGGRLLLGGFNASNQLGFFTGAAMPWQVETTETQLIQGRRSRVGYVRNLVEGDTAVSAAVATRNTTGKTQVYGPSRPPNKDDICPARSEGRYHRVLLTGDAGSAVTHIQGATVGFSPGGGR